jgi:hypothetical protein
MAARSRSLSPLITVALLLTPTTQKALAMTGEHAGVHR